MGRILETEISIRKVPIRIPGGTNPHSNLVELETTTNSLLRKTIFGSSQSLFLKSDGPSSEYPESSYMREHGVLSLVYSVFSDLHYHDKK